MRRVARLLAATLAAVGVVGGSLLAALALLGADPTPGAEEEAPPRLSATNGEMPPRTMAKRSVAPALAAGASASWAKLERSLPARIGLAVVPAHAGAARRFGPLQTGHAWSTIKVPIVVTLLREQEGRLNDVDRARARAALTASDNEAAAALFAEIEEVQGGLAGASEAVEETLRLAGDNRTVIATAPPPPGAISTYGQTEWSLTASALFFSALGRGCLLGPDASRYVLGLAAEVVDEQRWGLGEAGFGPGWKVAFKGGWGPEDSTSGPYLVRQAGLLRNGDAVIAVAFAAQADSGSFTAAIEAVGRVAVWLRNHLRPIGHPPPADC